MRPFGCPVTILNTIDHLGKFDGKADEGFFVGYSLNSKAFRVFNSRTRIVKENLHIRFSENTPNVIGSGPDWLFDIDALTRTMNYEPIVAGTQSNGFADPKSSQDDGFKPSSNDEKKVDEDPRKDSECNDQEKEYNVNSTNTVNAASTNKVNVIGGKTRIKLPVDRDIPELEYYSIFEDDENVGAEAKMNNLDTKIQVNPIPTTRIHKDHTLDQVIRDFQSATQTRRMSKNLEEHGFEEPKKVIHALKDPSWIEAMQEELLQFKLQEVWTLVDLPNGKRAIGTKWVFRNKKDERGRNKARLIKEEVFVCQPPGFKDLDFPDRVYIVEKALYGLHQAPRAWFIEVKTTSTPIETQKPLLKDEDGEEVDVHMYRYLKGQLKLGLWYLKDSPFDLVAYTDSDYAGASLNRKSTIGRCQFLGCKLISWQYKKQIMVANSITEAEDCNEKKLIQMVKIHTDKNVANLLTKAFDLGINLLLLVKVNAARHKLTTAGDVKCISMVKNLDNVGKFFMYPRFVQVFLDKQLEGMATHDRIYIAPSHTKKIFGNMKRVGKGFSGRVTPLFPTMVVHNQKEMGEGSGIPTDPHHTPTFIQQSPQSQKTQKPRRPKKKDTQVPQSSVPSDNVADEAIYKELDDSLVRAATTASSLEAERQETIGDTIAQTRSENVSKLSNDSLLARGNTLRRGEDSLKLQELMALCITLQTRVLDLEQKKTTQAEEIILAGEEMIVAWQKENVVAEQEVATKDVNLTVDEVTLAQALTALKSVKPKVKGDVIEEPSVPASAASTKVSTATTTTATIPTPRKGIVIQEAEKRRKHFAAKRAEEKRNKPSTQAQQRKIMCTYLKNMEGKKLKYLKNKSFDSIQKIFDRAFTRVNTFVDYKTYLVEGSLKRAGEELEQEVTKKQKVDYVQETAEVDDDQE
ncbi:retrotransposon protein, putative, unclassified [Tanacetum coccineum]